MDRKFGFRSVHSRPSGSELLEVSNWLLAPSVYQDDQDRTIAIGIIPDLLPPNPQHQNGWANVFSLPRLWSLSDENVFQQAPLPELNKLRGTHYHWDSLYVDANTTQPLATYEVGIGR